MKIPGMIDIARGVAKFTRYRSGELWYRLTWADGEQFDFPIGLDDAGEGDFDPVMKGTSVLRWARKHADLLKSAKIGETDE